MPDSAAKMGPALPKGDGNGLAAIAADLITDPGKVRVGIILFDAGEISTKTDTGERIAKARIRRAEVEALVQERFTPGRLPPAIVHSPAHSPVHNRPPDPDVLHDRRAVLLGGDPGRCQHTWPSAVLSRADGTYRQHRCGNNPRHTNTCICRYCGDPRDGRAPT